MRRHEDDLPAEHQAGAAGAGASVHAPGLQLRPPAAGRGQATQGRTLQPPHQDRAGGQAGAQLGRRGESDSCLVLVSHINSKFSDEDGGVERPIVLVQPRGAREAQRGEG